MLPAAHAPRKHSARRSRSIDVTTNAMMDQTLNGSATEPGRAYFPTTGIRRSSMDPLAASAHSGSLPSASSPSRLPGTTPLTTSHATTSGGLTSPSAVKAPRRYGFACVNCRKRKVRCDGSRPACHNCRRTQEECSYKKEGSDTQLRLAESRIALLEDKLRMLAVSSNDERERILREHLAEQHEDSPPSGCETEEVISQVSIDEDGRVCYFGPTSRFYLAPERPPSDTGSNVFPTSATALSPSPHLQQLHFEEKSDGDWLKSNSMLQKSWERLAFANVQHDNSIDPELSAVLLQVYWTWQHPLHNCVYRPCFTRDMALGGPYFSPFLLNVIYAHASRHANDNDPRFAEVGRGERFLAKAKLLLSAEMDEPRPRIPTIQGLLILGGRQCAIGKSSEGWLYTGMAIRMMKDVGLHLNARKLKGLEKLKPDDLEVRKRLFLSAYTWDKTISLCLGRPPSLTEMAHQPSDMLDNSDNLEEWRPVCLPDVEHTYPPVQSYTTAAFKQFCRLAEMITEIYSVIYNDKRRSASCMTRQVLELERKIQEWHRNLPAHLRIDRVQDLQHCPPPHIFSLNLLYHTILIIIFRPFYWCSPASCCTATTPPPSHSPTRTQSNTPTSSTPKILNSKDPPLDQQALFEKARQICVYNTSVIHDFFLLYGRTFNFKLMTYLVSYCVYTAATINVHEIKSPDESVSRAAATRLSVSLNVLESEARQTPGVRRSIDIIKRQLRSFTMPGMGLQGQQQQQQQSQQAPPQAQQQSQQQQSQYTSQQVPQLPPPQQSYYYNGVSPGRGVPEQQAQQDTPMLPAVTSSPGFNLEPFMDTSGGFSAPGSLNWSLEDTLNSATEEFESFASWMPEGWQANPHPGNERDPRRGWM